MIHEEKSPLAGQTVKIKPEVTHMQFKNFGGSDFVVEDWADRVMGGSWMFKDGNPACIIYALRSGFAGIKPDDEVLYGHVGAFGHLVHMPEIEIPE